MDILLYHTMLFGMHVEVIEGVGAEVTSSKWPTERPGTKFLSPD